MDDHTLKISDLDSVVDVTMGKTFEDYNYDLDVIEPVEFVIDGFHATGITIVAGASGIGKTSLLVPLYAHAAHLCPDNSELKPLIRRKVVYVSEDPEQVKRILIGMRTKGGINRTQKEFGEWFILKRAVRLDPVDIANTINNYRDRYGYTTENQFGEPYFVSPLIVLDTSNATINLENENDNSEVGQAVAKLKGAVGDHTPLVIVAHVAKALTRADIKQIDPRGAGAWVGDVRAVQFVFQEKAENERYLALGKRRFEADFTEIAFESKSYVEEIITPQGTIQRIPIRYSTASRGSKESRKISTERAEEAAHNQKTAEIRRKIIEEVERRVDRGDEIISKSGVASAIKGLRKNDIGDFINLMIEDGRLS